MDTTLAAPLCLTHSLAPSPLIPWLGSLELQNNIFNAGLCLYLTMFSGDPVSAVPSLCYWVSMVGLLTTVI